MLVEGTSGVGKSTLIDALLRRHVASAGSRKIRSVVHLAQSHTYGPLAISEDKGLTAEENVRHEDRILNLLEWLHDAVQQHDKPWCFAAIDTFHLTHCVRPGVVQWKDVETFDHRLSALGCKLVFLEVSPTAIWERGIVPRRNEQFILEYARKFGRNHEEIHQYFVNEQETLKKLFERSSMPKLRLDNACSPEQAADAAYEFWMEG